VQETNLSATPENGPESNQYDLAQNEGEQKAKSSSDRAQDQNSTNMQQNADKGSNQGEKNSSQDFVKPSKVNNKFDPIIPFQRQLMIPPLVQTSHSQ